MNTGYSRARKKGWERPSLRIMLFTAVMALALLFVVGRLIVLQLVDGEHYRAQAQANQIRLIRVAAPRGIIYDRSGLVLARSQPSFVVGLIPSEIVDLGHEIALLSETIGVPQATLLQRLFHHHGIDYTSFAQIVANEPYGPIVLAVDLPVPTVARLSEILTDVPGIDVEVQPIRDYPYGDIGSHILGYVGAISEEEYTRLRSSGYSANDVIGKDGLEAQYDSYLRGQPGGERIEVDASGQVVRGALFPQKPALPGDALLTSIDWRLQRIVEEALAEGLAAWAARPAPLGRGRRGGSIHGRHPRARELSELRPERFRDARTRRASRPT